MTISLNSRALDARIDEENNIKQQAIPPLSLSLLHFKPPRHPIDGGALSYGNLSFTSLLFYYRLA